MMFLVKCSKEWWPGPPSLLSIELHVRFLRILYQQRYCQPRLKGKEMGWNKKKTVRFLKFQSGNRLIEIQLSSAFGKFMLRHFAFTKDLHSYLFSLSERNSKRILVFTKKGEKWKQSSAQEWTWIFGVQRADSSELQSTPPNLCLPMSWSVQDALKVLDGL